MSRPLELVLLYGGKSGEHEISLRSAASVLQHLDYSRYKVTPVGMDKAGGWYLNDAVELRAFSESLPVVTPNSQRIDALFQHGQWAIPADVVFPVVHGPLYEDGCLQGLLSLANIAYVGSDVLSSSVGMDKDFSRRLACVDGVHAVRYRSLSARAEASEVDSFCAEVVENFGWPLFVKPCSLGSSVGIHKVNDINALRDAIIDAGRYDATVLVEECIHGREIEVAVLESATLMGDPGVSLPGEVVINHPDGFYSYNAKYLESDQSEIVIPAALTPALTEQVQQAAAQIFKNLKCKGLARVDFFVQDDTNNLYFNEINTLPGFTSISMYPKLWAASGVSYPVLLDRLIDLAILHQTERQTRVTHYQ